MTHAPIPPWAARQALLLERAAGVPVKVCWLPRKKRVVFQVDGVETPLGVLLDALRRESKQRGGRR